MIVRITVPGSEIPVRHARPADHAHEDPYVALRDAFRGARRYPKGAAAGTQPARLRGHSGGVREQLEIVWIERVEQLVREAMGLESTTSQQTVSSA